MKVFNIIFTILWENLYIQIGELSYQLDFEKFEGEVEIDETYFLYSQNGQYGIIGRKPRKRGGKSKYRGISQEQVCVLVARDRKKATVSKGACMGRIVKPKVNALKCSFLLIVGVTKY
jgi:hypothetical protein